METFTFETRSQWGARFADGFGGRPLPYDGFVLHHSAGTHQPDGIGVARERRHMRALEAIGQSRFGGGISYPWAVFGSGNAYQGLSPDRRGAHTRGLNRSHSAVVLPGDFCRDRLTAMQVDGIARLMVAEKRAGHARQARILLGHRQAPGAATSCPCTHAMNRIDEINMLAASYEAGPQEPEDAMAEHVEVLARIADATEENGAALDRLSRAGQAQLEAGLAGVRAGLGHPRSPVDDERWALRILDGRATFRQAHEALIKKKPSEGS